MLALNDFRPNVGMYLHILANHFRIFGNIQNLTIPFHLIHFFIPSGESTKPLPQGYVGLKPKSSGRFTKIAKKTRKLTSYANRSSTGRFILIAEFSGILDYENKISAATCSGKFPGEDTGH